MRNNIYQFIFFLTWCLLALFSAGSVQGQALQCDLPCAELKSNNLSATVPAYFTGANVNLNLNVASFFAQESFSLNHIQSNFAPTLPAICSNHTGSQPRIRIQIAKQANFNAWHGFFPSASDCINNNNMISNVLLGMMVYNMAQDRQGAPGMQTSTAFAINLANLSTGTYKIIARIGSTVAHSAFVELGTFTVMDLPAPPVALTASFAPMYKVVLNWQASNGTLDGYKIERSTNSSTGFAEIGTAQNTTFTDQNATQAKNTFYYRVRASNAVGNSGYSNTVTADLTTSIERQASWAGKLFPNPVENKLTIEVPENQPKTTLTLSSMQGKLWRTAVAEGRQVVLDLQTLPAGVYLLQIQQDNNVFTQKIIKK